MKICLLRLPKDVECWISSFVLTDAGYEIVSEHDIDMKGGLQQAWYQTKYPYPVIICSHSSKMGLIVTLPRRRTDSGLVWLVDGLTWDHDDLYFESLEQRHPQGNQLHKIFTCFCDFNTQNPTSYLNLPGYGPENQPGYWQVTTIPAVNKYRQWLGNLRQAWQKQKPASIRDLFARLVLPRILKYRRKSPSAWIFQSIT